MKANEYMPFIDWAMSHIERIYDYQDKLYELGSHIREEERRIYSKEYDDYMDKLRSDKWYEFWFWLLPIAPKMPAKRYHEFYDQLNNYYFYKRQETKNRIDKNIEGFIEALAMQFIHTVWAIWDCSSCRDFKDADRWECLANNAYNILHYEIIKIFENSMKYEVEYESILTGAKAMLSRVLTEAIDSKFTWLEGDGHVDKYNRFIPNTKKRKPDLRFICNNI